MMRKISNPVQLSSWFGISAGDLCRMGVLDPTLNCDTKLFIDPLLMAYSAHAEIRNAAVTFRAHFSRIIRLLAGSKREGDAAWKAARKNLCFPEIKGTCLGYGGQSISGSGSGQKMTGHIVRTAKEIVDLGISDPDLFVAMALFEEKFGPDHISDMTTNVVLTDLLKFNERILHSLQFPLRKYELRMGNGEVQYALLPENPFYVDKPPVILVPKDILRSLPIANDWSEISGAASKNEAIRASVNNQIAEIWKSKTRKDKDRVRAWALENRSNFEAMLGILHAVAPAPYDYQSDPEGELAWRKLGEIALLEPKTIAQPAHMDLSGVTDVVTEIIEQFRFLIEERRISEELYDDTGRVRPEKSAQRLFFMIAHAYCKANDLDLTPEADTGNGPVDFKVSFGFSSRVLVEIKLSTNHKLLPGYLLQLEKYKNAEETVVGYYLVIDVGGMGKKDEALLAEKNRLMESGIKPSEIIFVNGGRRKSASKLT